MSSRKFSTYAATIFLLTSFLQLVRSLSLHNSVNVERDSTPEHVKLHRIYSRASAGAQKTAPYNTVIYPLPDGFFYAAEVKFNGIPRYLRIDTGSADTWMLAEGVTCLDINGKPTKSSKCRFGAPYTGPFKPIKDVNFQQVYGSGELIFGQFSYANVSVAGLTINAQQVALATTAYYIGDDVNSGLLGLARQILTREFPGNDPSNNTEDQRISYPAVVDTIFKQKPNMDKIFSIALQRGDAAGYLSFGGLPPIRFNHDFVSSKFVGVQYYDKAPIKRFYPIRPQSYKLAGSTFNTSYIGIIDSGTYTSRLPRAIADKVNAAFDPPAKYREDFEGLYEVPCNATPPAFGLGIGGKTFRFAPEDMIISFAPGICASSILRGIVPAGNKAYPNGLFIIGGNFLHNVVAVFDLEREEMRFAPHSNY